MGPTGPWLNRHDVPPSTLLRDNIIILRAARGHRSTGVEEKGETLKEGERAEKAGVCHARWPTMSRELGPFVCQTIGAAAKTTRNNRPLFRIGRGYREEKGKGRRRRRRRQVFRGWWRWLQRERERGRGGLFMTARNIVNWLTSGRVDETFEGIWNGWLDVWLRNDCQAERNIVQELFEIVRQLRFVDIRISLKYCS